MTIKLTPEEAAQFKPLCDVLDARAQGYAEGIEAAKRVILQQILANRKEAHESSAAIPAATQYEASAAHAAAATNDAPSRDSGHASSDSDPGRRQPNGPIPTDRRAAPGAHAASNGATGYAI